MADEAEEGGGGGEAGGSVLKKYGPLAAIVLLVQVVLAWVVIQVAFKGSMPAKEPEEELVTEMPHSLTAEAEENILPYYYQSDKLQSIAANPAGTNAERFVVISVELGLVGRDEDGERLEDKAFEDAAIMGKIDGYMPRIRSVLIQVIRSKTIDQLSEGEDFEEVKDEIRKRLNQEVFDRLFSLGEDKRTIKVTEVNVSSLVIQ